MASVTHGWNNKTHHGRLWPHGWDYSLIQQQAVNGGNGWHTPISSSQPILHDCSCWIKHTIHAPPGHEDKLLLGNLLHEGYPLAILYVDCCWAFRFRCVRATAEPFKNFPVSPVFPSGSPTAHWDPSPLITQILSYSLSYCLVTLWHLN